MIIANPIYDVVFRKLMEDDRIAKFFISTLINETIEELNPNPQEYAFFKNLANADPAMRKLAEEKAIERLWISVMRYDYVATVKSEDGTYKKVLIEIQKAKSLVDLMRFRNYLAEQYKKQDEIDTPNGKQMTPLPIVTIYLLGFQLPEIEAAAVKIDRQYVNLLTHEIISKKSDFVEKLTHDSYIVQLSRIKVRLRNKLEKLLSIFEQSFFIDENEIVKEYNHPIDDDTIRKMIDILHHAGTDPAERKEIEDEQEAYRIIDAAVLEKANEFKNIIRQKDKALDEKDKALSEMARELEELKRKLSSQ